MGNKSQKSTRKNTSTDPVFCASCGLPFLAPKTLADKIKEDEYQDFIVDPKTKTSLLVATVYLPRCPSCTVNMKDVAKRARPQTKAPVLFEKPEPPVDGPVIAPAPQESE